MLMRVNVPYKTALIVTNKIVSSHLAHIDKLLMRNTTLISRNHAHLTISLRHLTRMCLATQLLVLLLDDRLWGLLA